MDLYAGIDMSLESPSVCLVGATGKAIAEAKEASEPEALLSWLRTRPEPIAGIGLEAARIKSHDAYVVRALLNARNTLVDVRVRLENEVRGLPKTFGVMFGKRVGELPMRKIAEALRLRAAGLSTRKIATSLSVGRSIVAERLKRAERAGLG